MKQDITSLNLMQFFEQVIDLTADRNLPPDNITDVQPYLDRLSERLQISTREALLLSACVNAGSCTINISDIASHFGCKNIKIQTYWQDLLSLTTKRLLFTRQNLDGETAFVFPQEVLNAFREDRVPEIPSYDNLSIVDWFEYLVSLFDERIRRRLSYDVFVTDLRRLITSNPSLPLPQRLRFYQLDDNMSDIILLLGLVFLFLRDNDEHVMRSDLEDLFQHPRNMRSIARSLEAGEHCLQDFGLVEFVCADGQIESNAWKLTDKAKRELLEGMTFRRQTKANLLLADKITPKQLFFSAAVEKQVTQLRALLMPDRFCSVQKRLEQHGMRCGFACIFYGAPGTGKTETVLQLARETGRSIKMVDVPNLRSKWVGDTEKNIKAVFDEYRQLCTESGPVPILLFNEADAVLCKRNEGAVTGVDKMENAMQNIILQEMETLDGIMIATTNLTGNLDAAFERRFLYKIEFPKPTADESRHIWQSMLPDLTEDEAYALARDYAFSGGQIENIARKYIVDTILEGEDKLDISTVREACRCELFNHNSRPRIGFS
ncbi:MAG: ATP-binding protein [Paludibacteraceae bacterium]